MKAETMHHSKDREYSMGKHLAGKNSCGNRPESGLPCGQDIKDAMEHIRKEVNREESSAFWHEMRQHVRRHVAIGNTRKASLMSMIAERWWALVPVPVAVAAALAVFMLHGNHALTYDDLWLMPYGSPVINTVLEDEQGEDDFLEEESFRGISNCWTALLAETI